jgi:S-DNA-T family DNA segregation ATPase FtsK/SpoIIIE
MKPIPIILSPTRNRALNMFLGLVLSLVSVLLFLALATYHPADSSMNTASGADPAHAIHNWIGLLGAYVSDILLQAFGITVFLFPLWIGGLGWNWVRSRSGGSPILRWMGTALTILFLPSVLGLFPWHWHWLHTVPVEGVMGRVVSGALVVYLNIQGAWLVSAAFAAVGVYFASDINFWKLKTQIEDRWLTLVSWHDRYRNWSEERAERKRELEERFVEQTQPGPAQRLFSGAIGDHPEPAAEMPPPRPSRLAAACAAQCCGNAPGASPSARSRASREQPRAPKHRHSRTRRCRRTHRDRRPQTRQRLQTPAQHPAQFRLRTPGCSRRRPSRRSPRTRREVR